MQKDYYKTLGINAHSTEAEVKKAFRSLAKRYHPDKQTEYMNVEKFNEVLAAYKVLSNKGKRELYDSEYFMENISDINTISYRKPTNMGNNYKASTKTKIRVSEGYGKINSFIIVSIYLVLIIITIYLLR
jgi:DnaJ-class molecular chaperone